MPAFLLPDGLLYLVSGDNFVLGSDAQCQVQIPGAGVAPRHVIVQRSGENWQAASLALKAATWHNALPMAGLARLDEGDVLRLGEVNVRWLPTVARVAIIPPTRTVTAAAPVRKAPAWMLLLLLLAAVPAAVYGSWLLWNRWQTATAVVNTPPPVAAYTATLPALATAVAAQLGTPAPLYRVVVIVATATPLSESPSLPSPTPLIITASPAVSATLEAPTRQPSVQSALPTIAPPITSTVVAGATAIPPETRQCLPPAGWQQITVKRNQTMRQLAQRNGTTAARLKEANCLQSNRVRAGQQVFVPKR